MCYKCKKNTDFTDPVGFRETCPFCGTDIHCCKNCLHYSPSDHYGCAEDVDEEIFHKESRNFCDFFRIKNQFDGKKDSSDDAKSAFDALFRI
ncbi:MAG: hypothetical protein IIW10_05315 [Spirochaetaceae bacterium]|nr:hypothetical protein [Spirochaetaceae bacterium]